MSRTGARIFLIQAALLKGFKQQHPNGADDFLLRHNVRHPEWRPESWITPATWRLHRRNCCCLILYRSQHYIQNKKKNPNWAKLYQIDQTSQHRLSPNYIPILLHQGLQCCVLLNIIRLQYLVENDYPSPLAVGYRRKLSYTHICSNRQKHHTFLRKF